MRIRISSFFAMLIIAFPICNLLGASLAYYDEILGVIAIIYMLVNLCLRKMQAKNIKIIILLGIITIIGMVSNFLSGLTTNTFAIAVDVLWFWKMFACYFLFESISADKSMRERIIKKLVLPAKAGLWIVCICSIIGQFFDIGVKGNNKLVFMGINQFGFFWNNEIQTGWLIFCCLLILSSSGRKTTEFYRYFVVSMIPMILTFSALVYCWLIVELMLFLFLKNGKLFKVRYFILLGIGVIVVAARDIAEYIMSDSVRMTFLKYGAITANHYFPFGSGFATFGSDMAARYYSKLYIQYGWENTFALGRNSKYLNDNFFAGILGQFGWIGFLLFILILYLWFRKFNDKCLSDVTRITCLATVITIVVVMIGSASAKSMMGVCTFSVLGIIGGHANGEAKTVKNSIRGAR